MEEDILKKYDLKKPYNCILYLAIALTIAGLILTFTQISKMPLARLCITILGYLLVLYYTFIGYQKPHGNLLFYLILCFGLLLILISSSSALMPQPETSWSPWVISTKSFSGLISPVLIVPVTSSRKKPVFRLSKPSGFLRIGLF